MKKVISIVVLFGLVAGAFFFLQHRQAASRIRGVMLAPPDTLFFAQLPDLHRTSERWPKTSLSQLLREQEVQDFLEKPKAKLPWMAENLKRLEQLGQVLPREAFVAVTSMQGNTPTFVAGLYFEGSRAALEELLADARENVRRARPAGKADIIAYAGTEIETYTDKDAVVAEAFRDNWYFVSNQLELLQGTIDRYDGKETPNGKFATDETYVKAMAALPKDADLVLYGQVRVLADRVAALLATAGQTAEGGQLAALQQAEAVAASVKMDDALIRDAIFVLIPQTGKPTPLARRSLALTTADTLLYYAGTMGEGGEFSQATAPLAAVLPSLAGFEKALAAEGLKIADFAEIFGPESSGILDWPLADAQPTFLISLDVRDAERATRFLDAATKSSPVQAGWGRREENGGTIYTGPSTGLMNLTPVIGLSREFLLLGFSPEAVTAGLRRPDAAPAATVDKSKGYEQAVQFVGPPTSAFAYLDTKTLFERIYGVFRPFLAMSMAFSPETGEYFDAGKLPTTDAIVRHLGPSTFSQAHVENGILIQSAGTLTVNQAVLGTVVGIGAAAMPVIQKMNTPGGMPGIVPPGMQIPDPAPSAPKSNEPAPEAPASAPDAPTEA